MSILFNAEKLLVPCVPGKNPIVEYLSSITSMYGHPFAVTSAVSLRLA